MTRARPRHLEDMEAMALMAWADRVFAPQTGEVVSVDLSHYPAGGKRNPREAGRLRRMGVKAGIPDFFLSIPANGVAGLFIELKVPRETAGRQTYATDLQLEQIDRLKRRGYRAVVCHGWLSAADEIALYLGIRSPVPCASRP